MSADILLSRLHSVRRYGDGWRADCPNGHTKSRGSLSITQADDGRVLLHCFACSDVHGVLSAVGLELTDLFPERIKDPSPEARQRVRESFKRSAWGAAVRVLNHEATVVLAAAGTLRHGDQLTPEGDARLMLAMQRIDDARAVLA